MPASFITGFALGFSLILAIGAQNAFVLRQGLTGRHVFAVAFFCAVSDALLIAIGVGGLSLLIADIMTPYTDWMFGGAAIWLALYGALRLRDVMRGGGGLDAAAGNSLGLMPTLGIAAMLTFANPHVYLDTVILVGTISLQFDGIDKLLFGGGAACASFIFFFGLAYGASYFATHMQRPGAWRVLDTVIAIIMFVLALAMARAGNWI
ncbi:LysE family transporter [Alphaproteobacteria bacterium]|nr:LysE family transporter [Alphaproteobacteria bacterium]